MDCQECHSRPATVHYAQVINGKKAEIYVCEVCAKEKGYMTYPDDGYSLHNLLTGLFNFDSPAIGNQNSAAFPQQIELQCPQCTMTYNEFKRIGKFGCASCYKTFSDRLDPIFRRVHSGNVKHNGKIPQRKGGNLHAKKQLDEYKLQLKRLIENEAFEEAATVRDKIRSLEGAIREKEAGDNK